MHIAVCLTCKDVIQPVKVYRSRTGTHGKDYYTHDHPLHFVKLLSSAGKRDVVVDEALSRLPDFEKTLRILWVYDKWSPESIATFIYGFLKVWYDRW